MMLNILQGQDSPHTTQNHLAPNVSSTKVEQVWFKKIFLMALLRMDWGQGAEDRKSC